MNCELVSVGTEILLGDILNTNAQYLSQKLASLGVGVTHQCTVGDNRERLLSVIDESFKRCDMIIFTGGLGPTPDDLTKEVCCEYFGFPLSLDRKILESMVEYFKRKGYVMPKCNEKQAMIPIGAEILPNPNGTAPGFIMEKNGKTMIILPGPPREMKPMFDNFVWPYLKEKSHHVIVSHNIRTFGIGESDMSERVSDLLEMENPTVAPYAKNGEALLRVTARAKDETEAEELMKETIETIKERLNNFIYGIDVPSTEWALTKLLKEKNLTVSFAESCTAGLCAKRITDISGSSQIFHCGVVSYSNEIKEKVLGVKKEHLKKYGAVSGVIAAEMALGIKNISGASFGVGITGEAGPTSGDGKEVGLIYVAVTDGKSLLLKELHGHSTGECRSYNREIASSNAFNAVRQFIENRSQTMTDIEAYIASH